MPILQATDYNFETRVLKADKPVLLEFTAMWCGPSKRMASMLEELAQERSGLLIGRLDVDDNPVMTAKCGVRAIPTFIIFKDGQPVATKCALLTKPQFEAWIDATV